MDKFWENYIKTRPTNSKGAFDAFAAASKNPEPRNMAHGGRIGLQGGGGGNPLFGTEITGALHKGKIRPANQEKLNKLIETITESNNSYKKTLTSKDALIKAGWKGGWQDIATEGNLRKSINKEIGKLNTTFQKMDNYVNNVMLAEDALVKDFKAPMQHIQKKFGVSRGTLDNWANGNPTGTWKGSQVYKDNKALFNGLRNQLSFNKYVNYADGTPRLMSDYSFITQNKMPSSTGFFSADEATRFIGDTAKRNYLQMKAAGLEPKVKFITDPAITAVKDWQFIDNETGRLFSMDPSIDTVEYQGRTYKNNYLQHKDARKLYKKEFGNLYKMYDDNLAKYLDADSTIIGKNGKPIKLDTLLRQQAFEKSKTIKNPEGKKDFLRRRFMEADHADLWNDPFGRKKDGLRLIDRSANQQAGLYKQIYKNNPKLLASKLNEIGYNKKFNNTDELIKFYSDRATDTKPISILQQEKFSTSKIGKKEQTKVIGEVNRKFIKTLNKNPALKKEIQMSLNAGIPIDDILNSPAVKKAMPWIKGEGYFAAVEALNNWTKGQSFKKGAQKAIETGTFGLVDLAADEKALVDYAERQGLSKKEIDAMRNYLYYMKELQNNKILNHKLKFREDNQGDSTQIVDYGEQIFSAKDVEKAQDKVAQSDEKLQQLTDKYFETSFVDDEGARVLQNMMEGLTAEEWNKPAGTMFDRGNRLDQGSGTFWDLFNMPFSSFKENYEYLNPAIKKPQQELMIKHPVYGYKE